MHAQTKRYHSLDGFRGLCILLVFVHNLYPYGKDFDNLLTRLVHLVAVSGWVGVQWFFVLSGFLVTLILLDYEKNLGAVKTFFVRRSLRIFPVYYVTLIILFVVFPLAGYVFPGTEKAVDNQF